jgi:hypothetical protein
MSKIQIAHSSPPRQKKAKMFRDFENFSKKESLSRL